MLFNLEDELDLDLNTDSLADSLESVVEQSSGVDALAQHSPTEVGSSALAQTSQKSPLNKAQSQESKTFHAEVDNVKTFCIGSDEIETRSNEIEIENHSTEEEEDYNTNDDLDDGLGEDGFDVDDDELDDELEKLFDEVDDEVEDIPEEIPEEEKQYKEDEVNLESVVDETAYAEINYPCLLLNGASTNEEVEFLRSFSTVENNSKAIYLYCEAPQGVCEIGYIKLNLKFLLTLSRMPGYRLYSLYSSTSERNEIKLDDPEVLRNFISL